MLLKISIGVKVTAVKAVKFYVEERHNRIGLVNKNQITRKTSAPVWVKNHVGAEIIN